MTYPANPADRSPKGDHNRRLSLGLDTDDFAQAAGISVEDLHEYETTAPDHKFRTDVAERVGRALESLERSETGLVDNGPIPPSESAYDGLTEPEQPFGRAQPSICPVSLEPATLLASNAEYREYRCPTCGTFRISQVALTLAGDDPEVLREALSVARHVTSAGEVPFVSNVSG
ncbi:hypothetical protein [Devosia sp. CN2-171]|jgi:hypothetical protein|uniref:hypothetical protein n=1 Tax=Devosia sp. CN2-171 TaxID=3400909 RepID=UPI003BF8CE6B